MNQTVKEILEMEPCTAAEEWLKSNADKSNEWLWQNCEVGEWLLRLCEKLGVDERLLGKAGCEIARTVLHLVPEGEDRPRIAIETKERWLEGKATDEELRTARAAARAAVRAAAWNAGDAAWNAGDAAWNAGDAAWNASATARAARDARAAAGDAGDAANKQHADIVRSVIPMPEV